MRSGETRRAAHSSADQDPGAGSLPLAWVCPTAIPRLARHLPRLLDRESSVALDVHGSLDRVKDVSSFREALIRRHLEECVRLAHADDVPLLILPEDTRCRRCDWLPGTSPLQTRRTDQDSHSAARPRRLTTSRESGCLSPLRREHVKGLLLFVTRAGPPLTPPTPCPHGWGQCAV